MIIGAEMSDDNGEHPDGWQTMKRGKEATKTRRKENAKKKGVGGGRRPRHGDSAVLLFCEGVGKQLCDVSGGDVNKWDKIAEVGYGLLNVLNSNELMEAKSETFFFQEGEDCS